MLAKSLVAPVKIEGSAESQVPDVKTTKTAELDRSDRMADTVMKLMDLESTLLSKIEGSEDDGKPGFVSPFSTRLATVRVRIDIALEE